MDKSLVSIQFCVLRRLNLGHSLNVIGNVCQLGEWDTNKSIQMNCTKEEFWHQEVMLPIDVEIEFKYFITQTGSNAPQKWDEGENKKLKIEQPSKDSSIKIMTFNIRYDNAEDQENNWDNRKETVIKVITKQNPDFIGMQEVLFNQQQFLEHNLKNYNSIWRGRNSEFFESEGCPIFYKMQQWKVLDQEVFWLSEQPKTPGSKSYGNQIPRICNWIKFQNLYNKSIVNVYNTHLDHENNNAKKLGALQIKKHMQQNVCQNERIILMGDFNCHPLEAPITIFQSQLQKLQRTESSEDFILATFHGFYGCKLGLYMDYILLDEKLKFKQKTIIRDSFNNKYPSDHFPVLVEAQL